MDIATYSQREAKILEIKMKEIHHILKYIHKRIKHGELNKDLAEKELKEIDKAMVTGRLTEALQRAKNLANRHH